MIVSHGVLIRNESRHPLPQYETAQSAGMDVRSFLEEPVTLLPGERKLVPTGIYIALPDELEAQVRPRSGLAYKHGITVLNAPGTIDADYRGEIKILLVNLSDQAFTIQDGDRIAQLVVAPYAKVAWQQKEVLPSSSRGKMGFGSTGIA